MSRKKNDLPACLSLRPVGRKDRAMLLEWANDPVTRAESFHSLPISPDEHTLWFEQTINDPSCHFFIILYGTAKPVGQIRFNVYPDRTARISISIRSEYRGRGFGTAALAKACEKIDHDTDIDTLTGYIKKENYPSRKMFEKAGFACKGIQSIEGQEAYLMVRERNEKLTQ